MCFEPIGSEQIPSSVTCKQSILFFSMWRMWQHPHQPAQDGGIPSPTYIHSAASGLCTSSTWEYSPPLSSTSHCIPFPGPHSHSLIPEPWVLSSFGQPSSEALGICFLSAWGCTLIHLYHRKQKTSLTSHLFHRWESNSLLNDCPEPTIQRGRIYSSAKDQGALL